MKNLIALLILVCLSIASPVFATGVDYTNRTFTTQSCELFAKDAYQAADTYSRGVELKSILNVIENAPVADSMKHRVFQAIQFVWKNQLDNPTLAYSIAFGLCLEPKNKMAPMDEPWVTSPRTSREFF